MNASSNPGSTSRVAASAVGDVPLPSTATLVKATGIALVLAIALLVLVVLPAEYHIDPTGFGKAIGLTRLSAPAATVTPAPETEDPSGDASSETGADGAAGEGRNDSVVIDIAAGRGLEYKFSLKTGEKMKYEWTIEPAADAADGDEAVLYFDFHGEPEGDTTGFFESYSISTAAGQSGTFTAPFDGVHGWYWKNRTNSLLKVTLVTSGDYEVLGLR